MKEKPLAGFNLALRTAAIATVLCTTDRSDAQPIMGEEPQTVTDLFLPEVEGVTVEVWVDSLHIPWSLVFLPNGDALVSERRGQIQRIPRGEDQQVLYVKLDEVAHVGDGGLMGLALHPQFADHPFVYAMYTYKTQGVEDRFFTRVVRLRHLGGTGEFDRVVLDHIPGAPIHIGGRIGFGRYNPGRLVTL